MIYVEWFKTEVNRSGKPARGRGGGPAAHAQERPGVFVTPHSFRLVLRIQSKPSIVSGAAFNPRGFLWPRFHLGVLLLSFWAGGFKTRGASQPMLSQRE